MAKGAIWMVLFKFVERSLGLASTLILARLLVPADFGVIAMALSFIFMAELLTALGFDIALIQDQGATLEHYNSAWTGNLLLGLTVTVLMLALAVPIANFYREPQVMWVIFALAFGPLISGAENIGVVAFRKELNFRREFKLQVARKFVGFAVIVPMAFLLRNYWALVIGILSSKLAGTIISYLMHPFRPRPTVARLRELFGFSRWLLFNNLAAFLKDRSTDFVIGRLFGAAPLGVYNIGYELATLPSTELSAPINRALLPGFAKMAAPTEVATAYRNSVGLLALLTLPAAAGIFVVAPYLVSVVLGSKWLAAIPIVEILALNGALLMFHSSMGTVLIGRGFPAQVALANMLYVLLLLALLALLGGNFGVVGAAYAATISSVLSTPIFLVQLRRCVGVGPALFARSIARPLLAALAMALIVRWILPPFSPNMAATTSLSWLLGGVILGISAYWAFVVVIWLIAGMPPGAERIMLERARGYFGARTPPMTARARE